MKKVLAAVAFAISGSAFAVDVPAVTPCSDIAKSMASGKQLSKKQSDMWHGHCQSGTAKDFEQYHAAVRNETQKQEDQGKLASTVSLEDLPMP